MKKFFTMFGLAGLMAGMMMVAGCGDDNAPAVVSKATPVAVNVTPTAAAPLGTVTVSSAVAPTTAAGLTALTIPATTTITSTVPFTTAPVVTVSTPSNGTTSGVIPAKVGATAFTVSDASGAVDISFGTTGNVTLGTAVNVNIPVVKAPTLVAGLTTVVAIKADGTTQTYNNATYTAPAGTISASNPGVVTVPGVTNFCWFVVNPVFTNPSGATGSASTFNIK